MSYSLQPLWNVAVIGTGSPVTLYTSLAGRSQIQAFTVSNVSALPCWVEIWWIASGGTAGAANLLQPQTTLFAGQVLNIAALIGQVMAVGDYIQAQAQTAASLNTAGSGLVMSP